MQSPLDPALIRDPAGWSRLVERVVAPGWHWLGDAELAPGEAAPLTLLPGCLDEPLLLVREGAERPTVLSNACTHRGHLVATAPGSCARLRCAYHGRRFDGAGRMLKSPGFEEPRPEDDLPRADHAWLGPLLFGRASATGEAPPWLGPLRERLGGLPLDRMRRHEPGSRVYEVEGCFPLWVDNYLEGFHIPFVHPALARALDLGAYRTEAHDWGVVQVGLGAPGEPTVPLPADHPDRRGADEPIVGYYLLVFPFFALNVYPWGISLNAVQPVSHGRTRVVYRLYVWEPALFGQGAGGDLPTVEAEDDAVVALAWQGVRSRLYRAPRLAVGQEEGVLAWHRSLAAALGGATMGGGG